MNDGRQPDSAPANGEPLRASECTVTITRRSPRAQPARCDAGGSDDSTNRSNGGLISRQAPKPCPGHVPLPCTSAMQLFLFSQDNLDDGKSSAEKQNHPASPLSQLFLSHPRHWQKGSDLVRDSPSR